MLGGSVDQTRIVLNSAFRIAPVDPRLFGGFLEHAENAIYGGVYEPTSSLADEDGFRTDVMAALRRLHMTIVRYPGGDFASGYHWMDGVGPRALRPTRREPGSWQHLEPNTFGTDEFLALCRKMDWMPMLCVNLGTGSPEEARNWLEYCNGTAGSTYADMRIANGHPEPYGIKFWCLGNEMYGDWELGHVPAPEYAQRARQAAQMMKFLDDSIEVIVCGSSNEMEWDRQVLDYMGNLTDYISLHRYIGNFYQNPTDYLAVSNSIDQQLGEMDAVCRFVQAKHKSVKRAYLSFDEWNVWYRQRLPGAIGLAAPRLYDEIYNLEDALAVAGFFNCFIRHADIVKIASLAQIVNIIAPILTRGDELLLQSIFYPFAMYASRREGEALRMAVEGPTYQSKPFGTTHYIDSSAILGEGTLQLFVTNRHPEAVAEVRVQFDRPFGGLGAAEIITGPSTQAANSFEQPDIITAKPFTAVRSDGNEAFLTLPPLSVVAATLHLA